MTFQPNTKLIDLYIKWIEQFPIEHAKQWAYLYKHDPEAAMCEASYWDILQGCGLAIEPNRDLRHRQPSPDFVCRKGDEKFYVEVTCIHMDRVTKVTALPDRPNGAGFYGPLNAAIFDEVRQKTPQCANLDAPALVAVGTFHFQASCLCIQKHHIGMMLTGDELITQRIDTRTGQPVGDTYLSTKLTSAAFLRPDVNSWLQEARLPVSGILVGGFGCNPPNIYGLLHPNPLRPFNRKLLDRIEFCQLLKDESGERLSVEWI